MSRRVGTNETEPHGAWPSCANTVVADGRNERNECDQDSEVTTISYSLRVSRGGNYEELYGDLIPTSIAFMRGRLGKETYSKNLSEQSGHLQWNPSPKLSHVEYVSFTVGRGLILLKINKVYGQT